MFLPSFESGQPKFNIRPTHIIVSWQGGCVFPACQERIMQISVFNQFNDNPVQTLSNKFYYTFINKKLCCVTSGMYRTQTNFSIMFLLK